MRQLYTEITEKDGTNVSNQMALQAIADWLTPRMRPVGSGASSDFEQKMFARSTVGLGKTKLANQIIVGSAIQSAQRDQEVLILKEQFYKDNKSTTGFTEWLTEDLDGDGNSDRLPPVYQSINTAAVGEDNNNVFATMADNNLIQEGEVFIDVTDPLNPQLRVFSKKHFYEN